MHDRQPHACTTQGLPRKLQHANALITVTNCLGTENWKREEREAAATGAQARKRPNRQCSGCSTHHASERAKKRYVKPSALAAARACGCTRHCGYNRQLRENPPTLHYHSQAGAANIMHHRNTSNPALRCASSHKQLPTPNEHTGISICAQPSQNLTPRDPDTCASTCPTTTASVQTPIKAQAPRPGDTRRHVVGANLCKYNSQLGLVVHTHHLGSASVSHRQPSIRPHARNP
jgi:hypothetical protein